MTTTLAIIIIVLFLLALCRRLHQSYEALKFKYKLYALRDQLRKMAINNKIDSGSWLFDYYDNSFSKAISEAYYLTLFRVVILEFKYNDSKEFENFAKKVEFESRKYPELEQIRKAYFEAVKSYLLNQHYISVNFFIKPVAKLLIGASTTARKFNKLLEGILFFPETSDSRHHTAAT